MCPTFGKTGSGKHYAKETVKLAIIDDSSDDDLRIPVMSYSVSNQTSFIH